MPTQTDGTARSEFERAVRSGILSAPPTAEPPKPTEAKLRISSDRKEIDNSPVRRYGSGRKKGGLNFLYSRGLAYDVKAQTSQASTTITDGTSVVVRHDVAVAANRAVTVRTTYGHGIRGAKTLTMTSKNAQTFQGTVDSHLFSLIRINDGIRVIFKDGQPAPQVVIDARLAPTINALNDELNKSFSSCGTVRLAVSAAGDQLQEAFSSWVTRFNPLRGERVSRVPKFARRRRGAPPKRSALKFQIPAPVCLGGD